MSMEKRKIKCIKTREPGGTRLSEKIRKLIIYDLRNLYSSTVMKNLGLKYFGIGR